MSLLFKSRRENAGSLAGDRFEVKNWQSYDDLVPAFDLAMGRWREDRFRTLGLSHLFVSRSTHVALSSIGVTGAAAALSHSVGSLRRRPEIPAG